MVSMLHAVLEAIQNQGGGDNRGPANKKRYSGRISGGSNLALNKIAQGGDKEDK